MDSLPKAGASSSDDETIIEPIHGHSQKFGQIDETTNVRQVNSMAIANLDKTIISPLKGDRR